MNLDELFKESRELLEKLSILKDKMEKFYTQKVDFNPLFARKSEFKKFKRSLNRASLNFGFLIYLLENDKLRKSARDRSE